MHAIGIMYCIYKVLRSIEEEWKNVPQQNPSSSRRQRSVCNVIEKIPFQSSCKQVEQQCQGVNSPASRNPPPMRLYPLAATREQDENPLTTCGLFQPSIPMLGGHTATINRRRTTTKHVLTAISTTGGDSGWIGCNLLKGLHLLTCVETS